MSEGDAELKDVLIRSLADNGILSRLQAQLRAAVYLALEKHNYQETMPPANSSLRSLLSSDSGLLLFSMLADFLKVTHLENTLEVLMHEAELNEIPLLSCEDLLSALLLPHKHGITALATLVDTYRGLLGRDVQRGSIERPPITDATKLENHPESHHYVNGVLDASRSTSATHENTPTVVLDHETPSESSSTNSSKFSRSGGPMNSRCYQSSHPACDSAVTSGVASPNHRPSPHDRDYQDDFDSARSPNSQKTSAATSGFEFTTALSDKRPQDGYRQNKNPYSPTSPKFEESLSRPGSRDGMSSVVRIYTRASLRSTDEDKSDIDEDEEDDMPEVLKDYSVGGDSIDQTIDSDDSLGLDHVEEVQLSNKPATALT